MPAPFYFDEPLDWPDAEKAFADRLEISAKEFYALQEEYRGLAWTVARINELTAMKRCKRKLAALIKEGGTIAEFQAWLEDSNEIWADWYSELVYRMAWNAVYSKARYDEINDPDVVPEFDWLLYDGISDGRQTDFCRAIDGNAWKREDFPDEYWTPNHYQERSEVRSANEDLLKRSGFEVVDGPADYEPAEGFRTNQNANLPDVLDDELERVRGEVAA